MRFLSSSQVLTIEIFSKFQYWVVVLRNLGSLKLENKQELGGLNRSEGLVGCECNVAASVDLEFGYKVPGTANLVSGCAKILQF